ncbi:hypothetical protein C1637_09925 [Chryseobacterium lactis]|uniref:Uncharacterized protein n=1 Tax=Chryseobacterium lactis TaxID=1241981 RepID=A0A3G6RF56_CHRLC|nr:hypothetical protein [Chryseobacterium lactis]AZA82172.1 hypothetical protein EG342_09775 [Chryseobacterium lactis]AZB02553.1 hypothetical protein EG341_00630 [Chryseobacterium lactis]PNW14152.1 hypothetical protein C1637_09925 [Chryseobacterium lactis]
MNAELQRISQILNEGIIQELHLQGHVLLDELEATIKGNVKIKEQKNISILEGYAVDYIQKMEFGVRPSELGSASTHLKALYGFYLKLGFDAKRAFKKAKRLLPHHLREGVPTEYSRMLSKTGERRYFIQATWKKKEREVDSVMDKGMDTLFFNELDKQKSEII